MRKITSALVSFTFVLNSIVPTLGRAETFGNGLVLPKPGTMVLVSPLFEPALIKGLTVHQDNPFLFDFIVDPGQSKLSKEALKSESDRMIKYFFAALTIPDKDVWVNLSPYEKDRMIPATLGVTALGRDLLAQDYLLKQLTASLIYPQKSLGKKFWDNVYSQAKEKYGTTNIPVNTFNKVWIVPQKVGIYEHGQTAFIVNGHLKVMLEQDYLSMTKHNAISNPTPVSKSDVNQLGSQIIRQIVLPEIEKEVNEGKNFSSLRQIFYAQALAVWFKRNLKEALFNRVYANKGTVKGIDQNKTSTNQAIYHQYLVAYKKGVFNFIQEDIDPVTQETIPRKYFSGGYGDADKLTIEHAQPSPAQIAEASRDVDFAVLAVRPPQGLSNPAMSVQTQNDMRSRVASANPKQYRFIKDAPVLAFRLSGSVTDIPATIANKLGVVDQTGYTQEFLDLVANGGAIMLQMNGDTPDFYPVKREVFEQNYKIVSVADVRTKNSKLMGQISGVEGMKDITEAGNANLVGALRTRPTNMIKMSEVGYPVEAEVQIEAPWGGTQTKPAGQDAYLVLEADKNQYYMVNTDANANPISYVPSDSAMLNEQQLAEAKAQYNRIKDAIAKSENRTEIIVELFNENWGAMYPWHQKILQNLIDNFPANPHATNVHEIENIDNNMKFLFGPAGRLDITDQEVSDIIEGVFWADLEKLFNQLKQEAGLTNIGKPVLIDNKYKGTLENRNGQQLLIMDKAKNWYGDFRNFFAVMKKAQAQTGVNVEAGFNGTIITLIDPMETYEAFEARFDEAAELKRKAWEVSSEGQAYYQQESARRAEAERKLAEAKVKFAEMKDAIAQLDNRTEVTVELFNENWSSMAFWHDMILQALRDNFSKNSQATNVHEIENIDKNMRFLFGATGTGGRLSIHDQETADAIQESFWADLNKLFSELKAAVSSQENVVRPSASTHVSVVGGDITQIPAEAVVAGVNTNMIVGAGVTGAIIRAVGVQNARKAFPSPDEAIGHESFNIGDAYVASLGGINTKAGWKYVISAMIHSVDQEPTADTVRMSTKKVLEEANKKGITSISFPAFGTGLLGMASLVSASSMRAGIDEFLKENPNSSLKDIKVVIFEKNQEAIFKQIMDAAMMRQDKIHSATSNVGGIDLSQQDAALRVTKDANGGVKIDVDPALIASVERKGISKIVPVIVNMHPIDLGLLTGN